MATFQRVSVSPRLRFSARDPGWRARPRGARQCGPTFVNILYIYNAVLELHERDLDGSRLMSGPKSLDCLEIERSRMDGKCCAGFDVTRCDGL